MYNLALSGRLCSGKSLVAKQLEAHGYHTASFAQPIYEAADLARRFILTDDLYPAEVKRYFGRMTDPHNAEGIFEWWLRLAVKHRDDLTNGGKPRAFLQEFGDRFRDLDNSVFVRSFLSRTCCGQWCCDDLRLYGEAGALSANGWKLVRLALPEEERLERVARLYPDRAGLNHRTETDLDNWSSWDYEFDAAGDVGLVPGKCVEMLKALHV